MKIKNRIVLSAALMVLIMIERSEVKSLKRLFIGRSFDNNNTLNQNMEPLRIHQLNSQFDEVQLAGPSNGEYEKLDKYLFKQLNLSNGIHDNIRDLFKKDKEILMDNYWKHQKINKKRIEKGDAYEELDRDDGAGQKVFNYGIPIDQSIDHKPLPIVKASNKIDAVVKVKRNDDRDKYLRAKYRVGNFEPEDHLEGVRFEQDGDINPDYRKEVFLGNADALENLSSKEAKRKLAAIFAKVDTNKNQYITIDELENWILDQVRKHIKESKGDSVKAFRELDTNHNKQLEWREYHAYFLMSLGFDEESAQNHASDIAPNRIVFAPQSHTIFLSDEENEMFITAYEKWTEVDSNHDQTLNLDEYHLFRHPEQGLDTLLDLGRRIFEKYDKNYNGLVDVEEFVALPKHETYNTHGKQMQKVLRQERERVFKNIDYNYDGVLSLQEVTNYVAPLNPRHATSEARYLILLADQDKDDRLSLKEMLAQSQLFMSSKMMNSAKKIHDEF